MNKYWISIFFFITLGVLPIVLFGQSKNVTLNAHNGYQWINVRSYQGSVTQTAFRTEFHLRTKDMNIKNWSLYVRLLSPMTNHQANQNGQYKVLEPSRMKIRITDPSGAAPSLQEIGTSSTPIPLSFTNVPIILNSQAPIHTVNYYEQWSFLYDILIDGGAYLKDLASNINYDLHLHFTLVDGDGNTLSESSTFANFQINPQDQLPVETTYSIQINGRARDGVLEFNSISDYVTGVSQTYPNGLTITSNTHYAVQVRALSSNLISASNNRLPVDIVSLSIRDPNGTAGGMINLSENTQTVFNGINQNNQPRYFDIRYFTQPNDERVLQVKPDSYQTTLMYTLIPQ